MEKFQGMMKKTFKATFAFEIICAVEKNPLCIAAQLEQDDDDEKNQPEIDDKAPPKNDDKDSSRVGKKSPKDVKPPKGDDGESIESKSFFERVGEMFTAIIFWIGAFFSAILVIATIYIVRCSTRDRHQSHELPRPAQLPRRQIEVFHNHNYIEPRNDNSVQGREVQQPLLPPAEQAPAVPPRNTPPNPSNDIDPLHIMQPSNRENSQPLRDDNVPTPPRPLITFDPRIPPSGASHNRAASEPPQKREYSSHKRIPTPPPQPPRSLNTSTPRGFRRSSSATPNASEKIHHAQLFKTSPAGISLRRMLDMERGEFNM